jgi:hypothetical protein
MRNGAKGWLHPFRDAPATRVRIRWYRVAPTNGVLDYPTRFTWDQWRLRNHEEDDYPGIASEYTYDKGVDLAGLKGDHVCGTADQWLYGCLTTDPVPPVDPLTGQPVCCARGTVVAVGGMGQGGGVTVHAGGVHVEAGGEDHGGAGQGTLAAVIAGGHESGGWPFTTWVVTVAGGHESGGSAIGVYLVTSGGGHEEGGWESAYFSTTFEGGSEEGGDVAELVQLSVLGGELAGGTQTQPLSAVLIRGGDAQGLSEPPTVVKVKASTGVCSGVALSSRIKITFTNKSAGCACLPAEMHLVYDGTHWQSVTNYAGCSGTNLINWYLARSNGVSNGFYMNDTYGFQGPFAGTCSPWSMNYTRSVPGGQYCGGGSGGFYMMTIIPE